MNTIHMQVDGCKINPFVAPSSWAGLSKKVFMPEKV